MDFDYLLDEAKQQGIEKNVVGAIILNENQEILLLTRKQNDFMGGIDELPSGNMEIGETIIESLKREVLEETGSQVEAIIGFVSSFDYLSKSKKKVRQYNFAITISHTNNIVLTEHETYKWLSIQQALKNSALTDEVKNVIIIFSKKSIAKRIF
jgi:8-oxo-dGTP diphosphatase